MAKFAPGSQGNGLKAKHPINLIKVIKVAVPVYLILELLLAHVSAYKSYDPSLSTGEAFSRTIDRLASGKIFTFQQAPGAVFGQWTFLFTMLFVGAVWYWYLSEVRMQRLMLNGANGTMKFNNDLKGYNKQYTDPPNSPLNNGNKNIIFTDEIFLSMDTRRTRRNLNVLVIGGSGAGKSRFVVKPNLCQMPINCNFICTDPAGELLNDTGTMLEGCGYHVKCFNLVDMKKSDTYNPLEYIERENDVILLADCLLKNTKDPDAKGGDDFWEKAMKLMLQAYIYLLWLHGDELGLPKNLDSVMKLLDGNFINEDDDDSSTTAPSQTDKYFAMIQYGYSTDANGKVLKIGSEGNVFSNAYGIDISVKQYRKFKSSGTGKTFQNMLISASARFSNFDSQELIDLTSSNSIDLKAIGSEKTALFIIIPTESTSFNFLAAMMYSQLFQTLYFNATNRCQGNYLIKDANGEIVKVFEIPHEAEDIEEWVDEDEDAEEIDIDLNDTAASISKKEKRARLKAEKEKKKEEKKKLIAEQKKVEHLEQFNNMNDFTDFHKQMCEAVRPDDDELQIDDSPGENDNDEIKKQAEDYCEGLKNLKLVKKGAKYIIRCDFGNGMEEVAVYKNEEYAKKRAAAMKKSTVSRCGLFLPYHVRFMLDEFANIGQIPNFTLLLATMRKFEISATIILQNLAQIKNMYKDDWGSIVGNCDSILLLGSSEYDTQEYFSKKLGSSTVDTRNSSVSKGRNASNSLSTQQSKRELMLPEEIGQMSDSECILIIRGIYPFRGPKYRYERHPNYKYTADEDKSFVYKFRPSKEAIEGRKKSRELALRDRLGQAGEHLIPSNQNINIPKITGEQDVPSQEHGSNDLDNVISKWGNLKITGAKAPEPITKPATDMDCFDFVMGKYQCEQSEYLSDFEDAFSETPVFTSEEDNVAQNTSDSPTPKNDISSPTEGYNDIEEPPVPSDFDDENTGNSTANDSSGIAAFTL